MVYNLFIELYFQFQKIFEKKFELEIHDSIDHLIGSRSMGIVYDNFMHLLIDFCIISIQLHIYCTFYLNQHVRIPYECHVLDFYPYIASLNSSDICYPLIITKYM